MSLEWCLFYGFRLILESHLLRKQESWSDVSSLKSCDSETKDFNLCVS